VTAIGTDRRGADFDDQLATLWATAESRATTLNAHEEIAA
jgi:hypothetical protein